jgi:predicted acylesterase/phospholipase RssA
MSAADMTHCRILRSYQSGHSSHNPTIIEAIRISWANPGLFPPLRIGPKYMQEELVSAVDGCNNPTLQAVEEAHNAFGKDQKVACLLSLGTGKPGNRSVTMESAQLAQMIARDTESIAEQLDRRYSGLQIYFRLSVDRTLELGTASRTIDQRAGRITSYTSTYLETHAISETLGRCVKSSQSARYITMESLCQ